MNRIKTLTLFALLSLVFNAAFSQTNGSDLSKISYSSPQKYTIAEISISGIKYLDSQVLTNMSGLTKGQVITVPGDEITESIKKFWKLGLFSDVKVSAVKIDSSKIYLNFNFQERPRLSELKFKGVKNGDIDKIKEKIKLVRGTQVTDNVVMVSKKIIKDYFVEKGYNNVEVNPIQKADTVLQNTVVLTFAVDKKQKVKIKAIDFEKNGYNESQMPSEGPINYIKHLYKPDHSKFVFSDSKLRRSLKETKKKRWYGLFKPSKYIESKYEEDKKNIIKAYNEKGYRDAKIISDSVYKINEKLLGIKIKIDEGHKYYFRSINWVGNTKYSSEILNKVLKLKKGDVYDQEYMEKRLSTDEDALSSLYLDDGYLFYNSEAVELANVNDSIDVEIRIQEGRQARINKIIITGNTKTNEHVARREIKTLPGELFSKSDIMRSMRELAQLGHFDPEKVQPTPIPDPANGTVDIEYSLEERANDQLELSGGWGANMFVGSLGLKFANFSTKNIFNKSAWRPLPTGDGQTLAVRMYNSGTTYQSYSLSFMEPWFGGKRPNSLSISAAYTIQTNGASSSSSNYQSMKINSFGIGFGRRLEWPDDYFTLSQELNYERYTLNNWQLYTMTNGSANNFNYKFTFGRNSVDNPLYSRRGSMFSLSVKLTPPYSLFRKNEYWKMGADEVAALQSDPRYKNILPGKTEYQYTTIQRNREEEEHYKWIEYHKWNFNAQTFTPIVGDLVFMSKAQFGFVGNYSSWGTSPFDLFKVGGDGLAGYNLYGSETIGLRGYANSSLSSSYGSPYFNKYTMEIRYPITLAQSSTIYALAFGEGGNAWEKFSNFNAFNIKRSAGVGLRFFLPMLGMLGIDWGYGFDHDNTAAGQSKISGSQFHFVMGQQF